MDNKKRVAKKIIKIHATLRVIRNKINKYPFLNNSPVETRNIADLRTQFDFTMIITHLDTIKDYMDTLIPINVNNGLSKVVMN